MNQLNFLIKNTKGREQELEEFFKTNFADKISKLTDFKFSSTEHNSIYYCYGFIADTFGNHTDTYRSGVPILTLDMAIYLYANKPYPKWMMVWRDSNPLFKEKCFVLGKFNACYAAVESNHFDDYINNEKYYIVSWDHAEDISNVLEVNISQIAEKFNVKPENLKIIK